ncbi:MAG: gliding motility-associated C-terminal domain-containing protein [Bacteroidales bacterium]|nr:gliding motility-associated C-terminal domain-containing protein [Bacteroidales bacterium]
MQQCTSDNGNDFVLDNVNFGILRKQKARLSLPVTDCYDVVIENENCVLTAKAVNSVTNEEVGQIDHWEDSKGTIVGYGSTLDLTEIATKDTYKAVAYFPAGSVITNGDFEYGMSGFKYGSANGLYNEGTQVGAFSILKDPTKTACGGYCVDLGDHTTGSGQMLFVDPIGDDSDVIAYDFDAIKDKAYILSLFFANACNFSSNANAICAQLSFIVENKTTKVREEVTTKQLGENNDWEDLSAVWTAPDDGEYTLYIRAAGDNTLNKNGKSGGNDFVIDDISFATTLDKAYSSTIEVSPCIACKEPKDVTLTLSARKDGYMCDGESITITTNAQETTEFQFDWFKGEDIETAADVANKVAVTGKKTDSYVIGDVNDAGTYWVRVSDAKYPQMEACWKEESVTITVAEKPTVTITGGDVYCAGETVSAPVFTFTGTAPFKFKFTDGKTESNWITGQTELTYSPKAPSAVGTYTYKLTALDDALCTAGDLTSSTTITIKSQPKITKVETSGNDCEGNPLTVSATVTDGAGADYTWTGPNSWQATTASATVATAATSKNSGKYTLQVNLDGCSDTKETTEVTIYPQPKITAVKPDKNAVCSGEEIFFSATITNAGTGTKAYSWTGTEAGSEETLKVKKTVTAETTVKEKLEYTETYSDKVCSAVSTEATAVVNPLPTPEITRSKPSVCYNIEDVTLSLNATYKSQTWTCTPTISGFQTTSASPSLKKGTAVNTYTIGVSVTDNNGCSASAESTMVTINDNLSPEIKAESEKFCKNETTTLSLPNQTYSKVTWKEETSTLGTGTTYTYGAGKNDGSYTISVDVEDANGCKGTSSKNITIYALPVLKLTPETIAICDLTSAEVEAIIVSGDDGMGGQTAVGTWSGKGLVADPTNPLKATFTANGYDDNKVSYSYVSTYGCNVASPIPSKEITVYDIPSALGDKSIQYCVNAASNATDLTNLYSTVSNTLTWYDSEGTQLAGAPKPSTANAGVTYYYVTQSANSCESAKAKVTVTVNPLPNPVITAKVGNDVKDNACFGTAISLSLSETYSSYAWTCSPDGNLSSSSEATTILKATAPASTYTVGVVVKDVKGCQNAAPVTKELVVHPIPVATLSALIDQCADNETTQTISATITPSGVTGTGLWTGNVSKQTEITASFVPKTAGAGLQKITYDFTSEAGCKALQKETSVEVFALPNITIAPSLTAVCEQGGATSGTVTVSMDGTYAKIGSKTPVYSYTSTTLTGVNETTGDFSSNGQSAGNHTIKLAFSDANGCKSTAETSVKINAKPVIDFDLPDNICDYANVVELSGKVKYETGSFAIITNGTVTFTGTGGVAESKFNPSGLVGAKTVTLSFVDENSCKADDVSHDIVVNHTDAPTPVSKSASKLDVTSQATVPSLSAVGSAGATYTWYLANDVTSVVKATTQDYQVDFVDDGTGKMKEGQYPAYVTQTLNGCQSEPAQAILTVTDCPVTSPEASKYYACVDEDEITVTAVSTYTNPETDETKTIGWFWDNNNIPVTTIADLASANPDGKGLSFTISKDKLSEAGNVIVYVAEYDATVGKECFSPATAVTVEVHAKPQPTITVPDVICSTVGTIDVTYGPATSGNVTSTLTAAEGDITDNKTWNVVFDNTTTSLTTTELTVTTKEVWGAGTPQEKTCSQYITKSFTVTNVIAPTGTGIETAQVWSSSAEKIALIPDMEISYATDLSATLSVRNSSSVEIGTSSPISMNTHITAEGAYTYTVQQWVNTCPSPIVTSVWNIVDCPTPAPTAENKSLCSKTHDLQASVLPTLNADNKGDQTDSWIWYSDSEGKIKVGEGENLTLEGLTGYTSAVLEETVYTFFVKQNGDDGTNSGDKCYGPLSAPITVTVHPNPVVKIVDMPVLCYYDETKTAKATVDGNDLAMLTNGHGLWSIEDNSGAVNSTTGEINLQFKGENDGTYTLLYEYYSEYADGEECYGKDAKSIEIEFAETPTTEDVKRLTINETDVEVVAGNIATKTGTKVNWYENATETEVLSNNNPWKTGDAKDGEVNKSYFVSQTIQGCESKREEQHLLIIKCPFEAPLVDTLATCKDVDFRDFVVSTSNTVDKWLWYEEVNGKLEAVENDNARFTPTADKSVVATTTYYVSYLATETKTNAQCESKKAKVTAEVLPLPEITFNGNPSTVCYDLGKRQLAVQVDYHQNGENSGVWSVDGETGAISGTGVFTTNFKPVVDENVSEKPSYSVHYSYKDAKGCENTATMNLNVRYVAKPVLSHHYTMTSQNIDAELSATMDAGDTVRWYSGMEDSRVASIANPWTTGDKGSVEVEKSYFAAQVVDGCESEREETTVKIVPCPIPAPKTVGNEMCNYDETKELTAVATEWAGRPNGTPETFYLYNADKSEKLKEDNSGIFVPEIDKSEAALLTFYISEYNSQPISDLTIQGGCESPATKVILNVKKTPSAKVSVTKESVCEWPEGENPDMRVAGFEGNGKFYWYEEDPNYPNCKPSDFESIVYTPKAVEVGTHPVWLVVLEDGCYSQPTVTEFTIKPIPDKPEVHADSVCEGEQNVPISAVSENGYITWYSNPDRAKSHLLRSNSSTYTSMESFHDKYYYYATQTVDGCQSLASEVYFRIIKLPSPPEIITTESRYCEYDNPPALKAKVDSVGAQIRWYQSDKKTYANTEYADGYGEEYQMESLTQGRNIFYASQTYEGCEGAMSSLAFYVYAKPFSPVVVDATMCQGASSIPTLSTNLYKDKWYADPEATSFVTNGYTHTPDSALVKDKDLTYYIVREQNECFSDTIPVTLYVFKTPTINIGEDTAFCIYDTLPPIVASVTPAFTEGNSFAWYISPNALSRPVEALDTFNIEEYKNTLTEKTIEYIIRAQYAVAVNDKLTCKSEYDTVKYVVNQRGRKPVVFSEVICEDEDIEPLRALGTPNITWMSLDGILPEVWHGQKYEFTRGQHLEIGEYRFMVCDEDMQTGCKSEYDTLTMTVAASAKTHIIGEDSTCMKETLYYYSEYAQGSSYIWNVTGGVVNYSKENTSSAVRYFDFDDPGIDTITLYERTWAGCEGFDTLVVIVGPKPTAMFTWSLPGASNIIELKDSTLQDTVWRRNAEGELEGDPISYTMYWNYGHQGESEKEIDTIISYDRRKFPITETDYAYGYNCPTLTVENSFGCRDSYTECVFVNIVTSLYMPTAFSPTNPAHSVRNFQPKGFNLKTCELSIYDKWGNLLWFSNNVKDGVFVDSWDGMYDGKMMQSGVYIWKMEATFIDGQIWEGFDVGNGKKSKFGSVTLLR